MSQFSNTFKQLRLSLHLTQSELGEKLGFSTSRVAMYERGERNPDFVSLEKIADFFNVDMNYLLGKSTDTTILSDKTTSALRIKVYGSVPAGIPLEAIEDVVDWEDIPLDWSAGGNEFIGLRVKGDSMAPKYVDGDTVIVKIQPDCESGQDAVIYVNGYEATLKKLIKKTDCIILQPLNPSYEPKVYDYNDEDNPINILGVVVELRRKI